MKREWQPGDVAAIPFADGHEVCLYVDGGWITPRLFTSPIPNFIDIRPLVVIDPEDREQVERLCVAYVQRHNYAGVPWDDREQRNRDLVVDSLAAALREFANPTPPRPDEPLNAAAVVEDADGDWWARLSRGATGAVWHRIGVPDKRANYRDIAAVRVLSEGVPS